MKWLEIIHLRSSGEELEWLSDRIRETIGDLEDPLAVTLYRRYGLDSDLAVHILHSGTPGREAASGPGLRIASALMAYGLVEHTSWEES